MVQYLTRKQAAEYINAMGFPCSVKTLAKYACLGGGPEFRKFSRFVRYETHALDAWVEEKLSAPMRVTQPRGSLDGAGDDQAAA
jgi:hypothetical protein